MEFLNEEKFMAALRAIYFDVAYSYGYEADDCDDYVEECACELTRSTMRSMREYVNMSDTSMSGNFANIRQDWDLIPDFVKSEVRPWGRFDDVVRSIDEGTISEEDLARFQTWAQDWYFTAFGTYNLKYNFGYALSAYMEVQECEAA